MSEQELKEKAKKHISDSGYGTGTNITLGCAKSLMVGFHLSIRREVLIDLLNTLEKQGGNKFTSAETIVDNYLWETK